MGKRSISYNWAHSIQNCCNPQNSFANRKTWTDEFDWLFSSFHFCFDVHVVLESLKILLHDTHKPQWNNDFEMLLQHLKTFITKVVTLTLPNTNHTLFNTVEPFEIGTICVLFQVHKKRETDSPPNNSQSFSSNAKKSLIFWMENSSKSSLH